MSEQWDRSRALWRSVRVLAAVGLVLALCSVGLLAFAAATAPAWTWTPVQRVAAAALAAMVAAACWNAWMIRTALRNERLCSSAVPPAEDPGGEGSR